MVSAGELIPDADHGNASSQADHDHTGAVFRKVWKGGVGDPKHDERSDDPVEEK